jgi:hypothetical protein
VMPMVMTGLVIVFRAGEASAEAVSVCMSHGPDIHPIYRESRYIEKYSYVSATSALGFRQSAAWVANIASWS